jgi:hypothetical protein
MDPFISACKTYISAIISAVKVCERMPHLEVSLPLLWAIRAALVPPCARLCMLDPG